MTRLRIASVQSVNDLVIRSSDSTQVSLRTIIPVAQEGGTEEVLIFTFPFAPTDISIDGLSDEYAQLNRPGRLPLVRFSKEKPITLSIKVLVTHSISRGIFSAEENLILLGTLAKAKTDVVITGFGPLVGSFRYRITDMSASVNRLSPTQEITMASVSLTLTQVETLTQVVPGMIRIKDIPLSQMIGPKTTTSATGNTSRWTRGYKAETAPFGYLYPGTTDKRPGQGP